MVYYLLAIIIGLGMTVQAGVNSQLRNVVGEPLTASLINFLVGTFVLLIFTIAAGKVSFSPAGLTDFSWWKLTGGLIGAFYIYIMIIVVPKIGPANLFSLVVAGQMVTAVLLDHFGWLGFSLHPLNSLRFFGVILLIAGVYIIQNN